MISDGTQLIVQIGELDYGDAPDTGLGTGPGNYRTLAADGGPVHLLGSGLLLGATVDAEASSTRTEPAPMTSKVPSGRTHAAVSSSTPMPP